MIGADHIHDDYAAKVAERERAHNDAVEAWVAAAQEADLWREVASRLARHLRAINRAGDTAARGAVIRRGDVNVTPGGWHAYRQATIDAGVDLVRIERALGHGLDIQAERTCANGSATHRAR